MEVTKEASQSGGPEDVPSGGFMAMLIDMDDLSDNLYFTVPSISSSPTTYVRLSIVVNASTPDDLWLNRDLLVSTRLKAYATSHCTKLSCSMQTKKLPQLTN